jgi:hypothetical protein
MDLMLRQLRLAIELDAMAKAKKSKPRDHQVRWSISLIKATPAKYLG